MDGSIEQLLTLDPTCLSEDDLLTRLAEVEALICRASARRERFLAAVPTDAKNFIREEVGCLLRWSFSYTQARLTQARRLVHEFPDTLDLHEDGAIGEAHTRALCDATAQLDPTVAGKVEARVLDRAPSQTPTEFKRAINRAISTLDPRGCEERHQSAKKDRGVWSRPLPDGMAGLYSILDAVTVEAIMTRIAALADQAKALKLPGDDRTADARRADALADLILGARCGDLPTQHGRKPTVNLVVPLDVALGLSDLPGELIGYGPIPASLCRETLNDLSATIVRFVVNPLGDLVDCATSYKPSQALADKIIARDRRCTFTSCYRNACRCELDHIEPFNGTNTVENNLQPLCCRHHHVKHEAGWTPKRRDDGVAEWISPTGRVYEKPPEPYPGTEPVLPPPEPEPDEDPPPF